MVGRLPPELRLSPGVQGFHRRGGIRLVFADETSPDGVNNLSACAGRSGTLERPEATIRLPGRPRPVPRDSVFRIKPYVPGKPIAEVERELGIRGSVKLASNENPLGPSPKALRAMSLAIGEVHRYPDGNCFALKRALAASLGVEAECVMVGNGSDELLKLIGEAYLEQGDRVVFAHPSFSEYAYVGELMAASCLRVPLFDYAHDLQAMLEAVDERTKLVFIANPNNPTGTIVTSGEVARFLDKLPGGVLAVFDEAYREYVDDPGYPDLVPFVRAGLNVVVLRTFSKIYGLAGLRVGYGVAPADIVGTVLRVREPFNVNSVAQAAAEAALDDALHVERSRELVLEGKRFLKESLEGMGLRVVPSQANFIFVDTGLDSRALFERLLRLGVIVRTGDIFDCPTFLRVTVGTEQENLRFVRALAECLDERRGGPTGI